MFLQPVSRMAARESKIKRFLNGLGSFIGRRSYGDSVESAQATIAAGGYDMTVSVTVVGTQVD